MIPKGASPKLLYTSNVEKKWVGSVKVLDSFCQSWSGQGKSKPQVNANAVLHKAQFKGLCWFFLQVCKLVQVQCLAPLGGLRPNPGSGKAMVIL